MTTIIRVKRHLQDDPVEALRLECKRRKTEDPGSSSFEKVLNFVGTVDKKDDCIAQRTLAISSIFHKRTGAKEKQNLKNHKPDVLDKLRKEAKIRSEANRFKVVSFMRSTQDRDETDFNSEEKPKDLAIVDVSMEKKQKDVSKEEENISDDAFVYDIYSANFENEDFNDIYLDNVIGIEPYTSQTVFNMEYRNPEDYAEDDFDPDEDDSNDENNWRNDYPDEEGSDSEEIDVLTCEFDKFGRGDLYELSSDDGEEEYANYNDRSERFEYNFYDEDDDDDDSKGSRYEKYKKKFLKSVNAIESFDGDEEDEETF